ncbi:hypothetical protein KEU06_27865 [Pseudaminobacter sp. 19-2017]|uniref:Uncharacterized protein n=1 Tax=Pseudaminobacter soli (ex Zhang et al. 2022) TaxID=2831468 RepID=A0A942E2Q9_9HYPH|nr:hypothetical protein [Pseudaminobacter soli]MBS3652411.1 hypothetical protein [Pseudaminobacter soli]
MTHQIQPFKQGQLDGLCGIYAIINAIRIALGAEEKRFRRSDWEELFYVLLCAVDEEIGAVKAVSYGLSAKSFRKAAKVAVEHMRDEHEAAISITRLIPRHAKPTAPQVIQAIDATSAGQAVIAGLSGKLDHWTICRRVSAKSLILFDSNSYLRIARPNCRMCYEPKHDHGRQDIMHCSGLWLATAVPGS